MSIYLYGYVLVRVCFFLLYKTPQDRYYVYMLEKLLDEPYWNELPELLRELAKNKGRSTIRMWQVARDVEPWFRHIYVVPSVILSLIDPQSKDFMMMHPHSRDGHDLSLEELLEMMTEPQRYRPGDDELGMAQLEVVRKELSYYFESQQDIDLARKTSNIHETYLKLRARTS